MSQSVDQSSDGVTAASVVSTKRAADFDDQDESTKRSRSEDDDSTKDSQVSPRIDDTNLASSDEANINNPSQGPQKDSLVSDDNTGPEQDNPSNVNESQSWKTDSELSSTGKTENDLNSNPVTNQNDHVLLSGVATSTGPVIVDHHNQQQQQSHYEWQPQNRSHNMHQHTIPDTSRNDMYPGQIIDSHSPHSRIKIPEAYVGIVIGKGGENVRRIQNESGALVVIESKRPSDENGNKDCLITGSLDSVKRAEAAIEELIERGKVGLVRRAQNETIQLRVNVPADKTGALIGRGGENIKSMRSQSSCRIDLDAEATDCGPQEKVFVLTGTQDQIKIAHELINSRLSSMPRSHKSYEANPTGSANSYAPGGYGSHQGTSYQMPQPYIAHPYWQQAAATNNRDTEWTAYCAQTYAQMQSYMMGQGTSHQATQPIPPIPPVIPQQARPDPTGMPPLGMDAANFDYMAYYSQWYRMMEMPK